jgi:hypothetical protein
MRKSFIAVALVVGMALGSVLTMVLNPVGAASALVGATASSKGTHQSVLQQALSTLVGNGTINQTQSNAITSQVHDDQFARWAKRPPLGRQDLPRVAALLGIDVATLRADLGSGQTLAQVATGKGISPNTLASQLTSALEGAINTRVSAHHLAQDKANTMKAGLPARVTAFLNRTWGARRGALHARGSVGPATPPSTSPGSPTSTTTSGGSTTSTTTSGGSTTSTSGSSSTTGSSTSTTAKH